MPKKYEIARFFLSAHTWKSVLSSEGHYSSWYLVLHTDVFEIIYRWRAVDLAE